MRSDLFCKYTYLDTNDNYASVGHVTRDIFRRFSFRKYVSIQFTVHANTTIFTIHNVGKLFVL
jgi:hypothetical protein